MEKKSNALSINTIVSSVVAVVCAAALCVTYATVGKKAAAPEATTAADQAVTVSPEAVAAAANSGEYMTEAEAAAFIGVPEDVMVLMRDKLGYFKGAYMTYIYLDANNKEVKSIVYNKAALNSEVAKLTKETGALSFKFLQESK